MSESSPGPWTSQATDKGLLILDANGDVIATVAAGRPSAHADARLLAMAWEMLNTISDVYHDNCANDWSWEWADFIDKAKGASE